MKFPLLFVVIVNLECILSSEIYDTIFWVPQNRLFDKQECNSRLELKVKQASTVYFMCPNRGIILHPRLNPILPGNMYENMWVVTSKTDFDNCNATNATSVLKCKDPTNLHYHSVPFNRHSPDGGLSFLPGQKYYFFATSDGTESSINNTVGGRCSGKDNITMKFEVHVCDPEKDEECDNDILGVLKCKEVPPENSSTTASTATSTSTTSTSPKEGSALGRNSPTDDKPTDNEKKLMAIIFALVGILVFVIVLFFLLLLFKYMNKGKSQRCFFDLSLNKRSTKSCKGYENESMREDSVDGKDVPVNSDCVIENKAHIREDSPQGTEEGQTKDKNHTGPVVNGDAIADQTQTQRHPKKLPPVNVC